MIYTLVYRCFNLCSDWTKFHREVVTLKEIFQKNGYSTSFIDNCFKTFLDRLHIARPKLITAEKKPLLLVIPFLGSISLQLRTKIRNAMKGNLNFCKLQVVFRSERKLSNIFKFKDRIPYDLVSGVVYKYTCGRCNSAYYGKTERHLKVRSGERIGISPLTLKKIKPFKESSIRDHLLECDNCPSFDEFTILAHGNKKYFLEIKESLLIKRDEPILNKNISSVTLHLFDRV